MLPVAVPQHYELQTCAAFGFPARFSNSSDAAYLWSPLFVRALMTSVRTAVTDGRLRPIVSRACAQRRDFWPCGGHPLFGWLHSAPNSD
jgi:hypothetical protein